jgi:hypothetical protein
MTAVFYTYFIHYLIARTIYDGGPPWIIVAVIVCAGWWAFTKLRARRR